MSRICPTLLVSTAVLGLWLSSSSLAASRSEAPIDGASGWLAEKAAYYEAHPEMKDLPGSGWKPYNRIRWEYETSLANGERPRSGARFEAWEEIRSRFPAGEPTPRAAWFQLGPENLAGRALALAFHPVDPNILYVGTAGGGIWRTTDEGATWTPIGDDLPTASVSGVAVSMTNPDIVVIGTGELPGGIVDGIAGVGILRSTDGGDTWMTTGLSYDLIVDHGFHIVEAGPNGTFLAGAVDGLWRSSDDGQTWDQVRVGDDFYDVKWKPGDPNTVYTVKGDAATGNNVKVSTNDGVTWTKAGVGQPPSFLVGKSKIGVTPDDPEYIYAAYENKAGDDFTGLYRSTDGGATWVLRTNSPNVGGGQGWYNLSCAVDPNNRERVIVGGVALYRSGNGGASLSQIGSGTVHVDHHDARWQPGSPEHLWVACDGGVYESTNNGNNASWSDKNDGLVTYQFYDICVAQSDVTKMAGGTQDNGTDIRTGTNIWSQGLGGDGMVCNIDPTNADIIYAETQFGGLRKSTNCGSSWSGVAPPGIGSWVTPVDIDRNDPLHLYTMRDAGTYRTTDGAASWTQVSPVGLRSISISRADGNVIWGLDATGVYSTDDGGTWTNSNPFPFATGGNLRILADPVSVSTAYVTFSGYVETNAHAARTTDWGVTWENITGDLPAIPVRAIAIDPAAPDHWYLGTDFAVWLSVNGGVNWTPFGAGIPSNAVLWDLEIQDTSRKLVAGSHGRGAWEIDLLPVDATTSPEVATRSLQLMLDPPSPNPARGEVVLRWASKRPGPVSLDVYDVQGRRMSRVTERPAGDGIVRSSTWYLDDVPAGVYFAVVEAGGERLSRKFVVLD